MQPITYQHSDILKGEIPGLENISLQDFWKWAFSDLCSDSLKGYFAEWIVMKLLGIPSERRIGWANSDLIIDGVKLEVKASSYWQSWKLMYDNGVMRDAPLHPISAKTKIKFAGLKARGGDGAVDPNTEQEFKSDIYVFAFQKEEQIDKWDAMDLSQWEFYVLPGKTIRDSGRKSIGLSTLKTMQAGPLSALEFIDKGKALIEEARSELKASCHSDAQ